MRYWLCLLVLAGFSFAAMDFQHAILDTSGPMMTAAVEGPFIVQKQEGDPFQLLQEITYDVYHYRPAVNLYTTSKGVYLVTLVRNGTGDFANVNFYKYSSVEDDTVTYASAVSWTESVTIPEELSQFSDFFADVTSQPLTAPLVMVSADYALLLTGEKEGSTTWVKVTVDGGAGVTDLSTCSLTGPALYTNNGYFFSCNIGEASHIFSVVIKDDKVVAKELTLAGLDEVTTPVALTDSTAEPYRAYFADNEHETILYSDFTDGNFGEVKEMCQESKFYQVIGQSLVQQAQKLKLEPVTAKFLNEDKTINEKVLKAHTVTIPFAIGKEFCLVSVFLSSSNAATNPLKGPMQANQLFENNTIVACVDEATKKAAVVDTQRLFEDITFDQVMTFVTSPLRFQFTVVGSTGARLPLASRLQNSYQLQRDAESLGAQTQEQLARTLYSRLIRREDSGNSPRIYLERGREDSLQKLFGRTISTATSAELKGETPLVPGLLAKALDSTQMLNSPRLTTLRRDGRAVIGLIHNYNPSSANIPVFAGITVAFVVILILAVWILICSCSGTFPALQVLVPWKWCKCNCKKNSDSELPKVAETELVDLTEAVPTRYNEV